MKRISSGVAGVVAAAAIALLGGCSIFAGLGIIHAVYTFTTNKFDARDAGLNEAMKRISPVPTKEISMWKAWVGFNASHSLGGYRVRRRLHRGDRKSVV